MFQSVLARAQRAVDMLVSKLVTRAAVALPFVIAFGFGTAAAAVKLSEMLGSAAAYAVIAGAFVLIGLIAAAATAYGPAAAPPADAKIGPEPDYTRAEKPALVDPDLVLTALGAFGPAALPALVRLLARNFPLVVGLVIVGYLMMSEPSKATAASGEGSA